MRLLENVTCIGDEATLDECDFSSVEMLTCGSYEISGVKCSTSSKLKSYNITEASSSVISIL